MRLFLYLWCQRTLFHDPSRGVEPLYPEYKSGASPGMLRENKKERKLVNIDTTGLEPVNVRFAI